MNKERKKMLACLAVLAVLAVSVPVLESGYGTVYAEEGESISSNSADGNEEGESVSANSAGISMFSLGNSRSAAEVMECSSIQELQDCLAKCNADTAMEIKLTSSMDSIGSESFQITSGDITLNLNGFSMTGANGNVFEVSGGSLTITGDGSIESDSGFVILAGGGDLVIEGGNIVSKSGAAIGVTGGSVTVTGGSIQGTGYSVHVMNGEILVEGGRIEGSSMGNDSVALMVNTGAKATITGGDIIENLTSTNYGYACYAVETSEIHISGGTFSLKGDFGKSLWIDSGVTATITGGTYDHAIAKKVTTAPAQSELYKVFYGEPGSRDIIKGNYILTDNTFTYEQNFVRTQQNVSIVKGSIITLNTNRSSVETYQADETAAKEAADNGGIVFVGAEGKLYSDDSIEPELDFDRVPDGNIYEWGGWKDASGAVWDSASAYAQKNSGADAVLTGVWNQTESGDTNTISGPGKYYLISGTEYIFGSGKWTVAGDSTVYNGGRDFSVEKDGEYEFNRP